MVSGWWEFRAGLARMTLFIGSDRNKERNKELRWVGVGGELFDGD